MKYRQWKKNYKKKHGVNPPLELDKRKQRRLARKMARQINKTLPTAAETLTAAINRWAQSIKPALATLCENVAAAFSNMAAGLREESEKGCEALKEAGYEETGKIWLEKRIRSYGIGVFVAAIGIICIVGLLTELHMEKRRKKALDNQLAEKDRELEAKLAEEKEFLHRDRQKMGTYMENISHQLKTPIAGTLLNLEVLLVTEEDEKRYQKLEDCVKKVQWMSDMTIVLLRLAQIDSGKIWMKRKKENLTGLIEECIDRTQPLAEEKGVGFEMDVPKECLLSCDGFWLKEAMENVLKNAVEYADTGSLIQILLKEDTDYYKLYITNRGKRIEEEKRELIFDRFYQMEQGSGIGIGLHLAKEIVTLHQGTLKVVDRSGLEEATTFQFILPKMIAKDHAQEEINLTIS